MRLQLDRSICAGHGRCYAEFPDLFDFDDDGYGVVREGDVEEKWDGEAALAAGRCPERAISIER